MSGPDTTRLAEDLCRAIPGLKFDPVSCDAIVRWHLEAVARAPVAGDEGAEPVGLLAHLVEKHGLHRATANLVIRFAQALGEKLAAAELKYGYADEWLNDDWRDDLIARLQEHVEKGDPRDVAAYCALAWHHNWSISPHRPSAEEIEAARTLLARRQQSGGA